MGISPSTPQRPQHNDGNSPLTALDETTWMPNDKSDVCLVCEEAFTLFKRRHHCRNCQKLVCSTCSPNKWRFDSGVSGTVPQRVCNDCFSILVAQQEQVLVGRDAASLESGEYVHFEVIVHEIVGKIIKKAHREMPPQDLENSRDDDKGSSDTGSSNIFCRPTTPREDPPREETTMQSSSDVLTLARAPHCRLTVAGKEVGKTNPVEAKQGEDADAERCSFNETFFFRVSCGSRNADYVVLEVFDGGNMRGHCRVPIFRTPRDGDSIFWHVLLKVGGAPGAVGRVLVTVRNLGAGSIRRPAWDHSIPGGCQVTAPTDLTPPPDNPLLEEFFQRDSEMHNTLFFRFGEKDEEFLPFNERTLEILPRVRMCPLVHHTSDDSADPSSYSNGSDSNTCRTRVDSRSSIESPVSHTPPKGLEGAKPSVSAPRARAGSRGGISEGVSPSSAGWSDSWDNSVSLRGEGRSRGFLNRYAVSKVVNGALVLTTHRVLFVGGKRGEVGGTLVEMPLAFITKMGVEHKLRKGLINLQIDCRDRKKIPFVIRKTVNQTWVTVIHSVRRFEEGLEWLAREDNFAHSSDTRRVNASLDKEGASLALFPDLNSCLGADPLDLTLECTRGFPSDYHPAREHKRQGVDKEKKWRRSRKNCDFTLCSTYGRHLVVPDAMDSSAVEKAFKGRSRHRIPALTWLHPRTNAALCRSSQPMLGINPTQSLLDDVYNILKAIQKTATSSLVSTSRAHSRSTSISGSPISITTEGSIPVANEPWSVRGKAHLSDHTESLNDLIDSSLPVEANNDNVSEEASERAEKAAAEAGQESDPSQEKPIITEGLFETLEEKEELRLEPSVGTVDADTIGGAENPPVTSLIANSEGHPEAGLAGDLEECEAGGNQIGNACLINDREDEGSAAADDSTRLAQNSIEQRSTCSEREASQNQSPPTVLVAGPEGAEESAIKEIEEERAAIEEELEGELEEVESDRVDARIHSSPSLVSMVPYVQGSHSAHSNPNTIVLKVSAPGVAAVAVGTNAPPRLSSGPASPSTGGRGNFRTRKIAEKGVNTANRSRHSWSRANSESNVMKPGVRRRLPVLRILDGRSMLLAKYHQVIGMGHEDISRLGGERESSIAFLDIPNKSGVQKSFAALMETCCLREDDPAWLFHVHNSRWLEYVSMLLKGASIVCTHLESGEPVLVHCSDGWDRTPQLTALAQLMLDPYYRTIRGFQVLVEKDWCEFGHQFATRGGHGLNPEARTAPIFPQFLDATYQLLRQYPESFEFSENLLILLMHAYYSRWFNNFLHDNEHERVLAYARSSLSKVSGGDSTVSLWTHVEFCPERYENVLWNHDQSGVVSDTAPLWPAYGVRYLVFWEGAWAGRGLQHPGCGWLNNVGSTMEDALRNLVQKQQSIIKMLRLGREFDGALSRQV